MRFSFLVPSFCYLTNLSFLYFYKISLADNSVLVSHSLSLKVSLSLLICWSHWIGSLNDLQLIKRLFHWDFVSSLKDFKNFSRRLSFPSKSLLSTNRRHQKALEIPCWFRFSLICDLFSWLYQENKEDSRRRSRCCPCFSISQKNHSVPLSPLPSSSSPFLWLTQTKQQLFNWQLLSLLPTLNCAPRNHTF
jgi:hypothetical protein